MNCQNDSLLATQHEVENDRGGEITLSDSHFLRIFLRSHAMRNNVMIMRRGKK